MADLSKVIPSQVMLDIKYPGTTRSTGVTVELMSLDDERMRKLKRSLIDRRQKLEARGKVFSADELETNGSEVAFAAIVGWSWGKDEDGDEATFQGEKPELSRANVMAVFTALPWFREQIDVKIGERESFFAR
jgi:hypothetical protein